MRQKYVSLSFDLINPYDVSAHSQLHNSVSLSSPEAIVLTPVLHRSLHKQQARTAFLTVSCPRWSPLIGL